MTFHNVSQCGMNYLKLIMRNMNIKEQDVENMRQKCYAQIKRQFFSLRYEHVILEDKMSELALLIACTKLVGRELNVEHIWKKAIHQDVLQPPHLSAH